MAEVDTSSYPRASLPVQKSALDQVQQLGTMQQQQQQIQSGGLTIEKQKLDLVNQRFGEMAKGFTALLADPSLDSNKFRKYVQDQVKLGYVPPEMAATTLSNAPTDPAQLKGYLKTQLQHAQTVVEAINTHFGSNENLQDNQNVYQGVRQSPMQGGAFTPATTTPIQLPPTLPIQNAQGAQGVVGPAGPAGPQPSVPMPRARPGLPVAASPTAALPVAGPTGPTVNNGTEFNNRFSGAFPTAVQTAPAPGVAAANAAVAEESGKDYATDLKRAKNYQADLYPATAALEGIKELGTQGVGPGTEGLNNIKSALITWLPNASKEDIDKVGKFEETRKYLTQIARSSGATGTNDQLAAAFEANPSIKLSQAATENVLKSVIALRRMQHAQTLLFGQQGLQPSEYSQWISKNQNTLDPRAFGFDIMDNNAKKKLMSSMATQDGSGNWIAKKGKEKDFQKFEQSLSFANDAGLIEPPGRK